jgi:H+-transporting ATPase
VLTYTLGILVNKCATLIVMGAGLVMTGHAVLTPLLQALSMLAGDMVTISRTADHARPSAYPNRWRVRELTLAAIPLGVFKLAYCLGVLALGWFGLGLAPAEMQTLTFLMLIFAGQSVTYVLRERRHFWRSLPAWIMVVASITDLTLVTSLALGGVLMTRLPAGIVGGLFAATLCLAFVLDEVKVTLLRWLRID